MSIIKVIGKIILTQSQEEILRSLGVSYIAADNPQSRTDTEEIIARIGDAEAIIINISTPVTRKVIKKCRHLKFIQTWSTGTDNIDLEAALAAGIIIKNVPDFSVEAVAEKTLAMMIYIANQMREANQHAMQGHWNYTAFQGVELKGKTLGIIGKGAIGLRVAELANAFGMLIMQADSKTSQPELYELYARADFLTLHCPLTQPTYHLISKNEFSVMKKGVYLVNNSRGGVVDEAELLIALNQGIVRYASMDVFEKEPPLKHNALLHHPNVLVTPHIAWNTQEAVKRLSDSCIYNLQRYLAAKQEQVAVHAGLAH